MSTPPPRKSAGPPARKVPAPVVTAPVNPYFLCATTESRIRLQVNRTFDTVEELNGYLEQNYKGRSATVIKSWRMSAIAAVIEFDKDKPVTESKKKK